jgi:hypothetical protein
MAAWVAFLNIHVLYGGYRADIPRDWSARAKWEKQPRMEMSDPWPLFGEQVLHLHNWPQAANHWPIVAIEDERSLHLWLSGMLSIVRPCSHAAISDGVCMRRGIEWELVGMPRNWLSDYQHPMTRSICPTIKRTWAQSYFAGKISAAGKDGAPSEAGIKTPNGVLCERPASERERVGVAPPRRRRLSPSEDVDPAAPMHRLKRPMRGIQLWKQSTL